LKTSRIFIGFEQLSSSIGQQVMSGQRLSYNCGFAVVERFSC